MSESAGDTGQEPGQQAQGTSQEDGQQGGTGQESGQQGQEGQESQTFDLDAIQDPALKGYLSTLAKDVRESRQEAANYRTQLRQTQNQLQELTRKGETDADRQERERKEAQEERAKLIEENRNLKVGQAAVSAATKAMALNPATVAGLISSKVTLDENGDPTNVDALISDLKRTDAYLFKRISGDAGGGGGEQRPANNMNDNIRNALGRGAVTTG